MGIVIRQGFWGTLIAYLGVIVGYLNTLYLRPEFFDLGQIGLFNLVTSNAMLISPLCTAGMAGTFIKYYPDFPTGTDRNRLFTFQVIVILLVNALVIAAGFLFRDVIASYFADNSPEYVRYLGVTAVVVLVNSVFDLLFSFCRSYLSILVPSFLRDIFLRLGAVVLVGGFAAGWWDFHTAVVGIGINYALTMLLLLAYAIFKYNLRFDFDFTDIRSNWLGKILNYAWYGMLLALSFSAMSNVSYMQVAAILGDRANGIYTTCFFIGLIVELPRRNMTKVLSPLFAKSLQAGDMPEVRKMYEKGSITMSAIGILILIGILTNVQDLFAFIPQGDGFAEGLWVVVMVCGAQFFMMMFSFSQEVLVFSAHYRYSLYFQVLAACVLIVLNSLLIPIWGLNGAGLSYLIAIVLHTLMKYFYLKRHMHLSPFVNKHLPLLVIGAGVLALFWWLPLSFSPVINIAVRSVLTTLVYVLLIWKWEISEDINKLIQATFDKIRIR